jgi:hypothetical protein
MVIAIVLFRAESILVTGFPHFHSPIGDELMKFSLTTSVFLVILIFAYKRLLHRMGCWLLLSALLVVHAGSYALFLSGEAGIPLRDDTLIGTMAGLEFIGFALIGYRVYRVGPNMKWLQSRSTWRAWRATLRSSNFRLPEEIFKEGQAAGNRQQKNLLDNSGAALNPIVNLVRLNLFSCHHGGYVLRKIHATLFARPALALLVFARRALKP